MRAVVLLVRQSREVMRTVVCVVQETMFAAVGNAEFRYTAVKSVKVLTRISIKHGVL